MHRLVTLANLALEAPWPRPRRVGAITLLLTALVAPTAYMTWIQARYQPQLEAITSSIIESITDTATTPSEVPDQTASIAPGQPRD